MQILLILIFTTYFLSPFSLATVSGYGVTSLDVVLLIFYIYILKKVLWDGDKLRFTLNPATIAVFCLIIAAIVSSINPLTDGSPKLLEQYFKTSIHFLFLTAFSLIVCVYPIDAKKWSNVVRLWLILGFIINLFAVYQIIARAYDLPLAWIQYTNVSLHGREAGVTENNIQQLSLQYGDFFRATSIFSEPSALASFNIFMLIFIFIPFIQKRKQFFNYKFVTISFIVASIIALFLTFSMTGAVGIGLVFGSVLFLERLKGLKTILRTLLLTIAIIIIADYGVSTYANVSVLELFQKRITGILNYGTRDKEKDVTPGESMGSRLFTANESVKVWQDYPVTGIGLGLTSYNKKHDIGFSDFSILAALAEMGIVGFLSFLTMFVSLFGISYFFIRQKERQSFLLFDQQRLMGMCFYMMLLQFVINFVSGNNLVSIGLWIPVALIFSIINNFYVQTSDKVYTVSLVKEPLKFSFGRALGQYEQIKKI